MDRDQRFEALATVEAEATMALAEEVLATAPVAAIVPPRVGTLMLRLREPVAGSVFNAGEVLITEARVALAGHEGYAVRFGREPEATVAAAVLDVAVAAGHPLTERIVAFLDQAAASAAEQEEAAWRELAPTRVDFDEMH